jgi:hypothetical protein
MIGRTLLKWTLGMLTFSEHAPMAGLCDDES